MEHINNSNKPTVATVSNEDEENVKKLSEFITKVLNNSLSKLNTERPLESPIVLVEESNQPLKISELQFETIILQKSAEIMATKYHKEQMSNANILLKAQLGLTGDCQFLKCQLQDINDKLKSINLLPPNGAKHVRNVGTDVQMPITKL